MSNTQLVLDDLAVEPLERRNHINLIVLKTMIAEELDTWRLGHNTLTKGDYLLLSEEITMAKATLAAIAERLLVVTK